MISKSPRGLQVKFTRYEQALTRNAMASKPFTIAQLREVQIGRDRERQLIEEAAAEAAARRRRLA